MTTRAGGGRQTSARAEQSHSTEPQGNRAVTDFDHVDYYLDPSLADDPHPYFHHIRAKCPVVHLPHHDVMAVTTYDATAEVLRDHETFSSCNAVGGPFPGFSVKPEPSDDISEFIAEHRGELPMSEYAVALDQPEHQAQRGRSCGCSPPSACARTRRSCTAWPTA